MKNIYDAILKVKLDKAPAIKLAGMTSDIVTLKEILSRVFELKEEQGVLYASKITTQGTLTTRRYEVCSSKTEAEFVIEEREHTKKQNTEQEK